MRKTLILSALLLASSAFAEDNQWRISILASEIETGRDSFAGTTAFSKDPHPGFAIGIAYVPAPEWDVEFTVATQTHRSPYTRVFYVPVVPGQPGAVYPSTEFRDYRVYPVDLSVTRHFLTDRVLAPYVRAGARYIDAPDDPGATTVFISPLVEHVPVQVSEGFGFRDRVSAQAGAGLRVRLTERIALRGEATRLLRSQEMDFDPLLRYAVGFAWAF